MFDDIARIRVDIETGQVRLGGTDGRVLTARGEPFTADFGDTFRSFTYFPGTNLVALVGSLGETLVVEIQAGRPSDECRRGRPVVYLDQNKWVLLAQALHSPEKVHPPELGPALELVRRARRGELILPLSSGHIVEASYVDGQQRQRVASTMIDISRGWTMRDPVGVQRMELTGYIDAFSRGTAPQVVDGVIALDARPSFTWNKPDDDLDLADVWPLLRPVLGAIGSLVALYSTLLADERLISGRISLEEWAQWHNDLAAHISASSRPAESKRLFTMAKFVEDNVGTLDDIMTGRLTDEQTRRWLLEESEERIAAMPFTGRFREVVHMRLMNPRDRWKPNDLVDLLFLGCASAYADHVIGERKTIDYLRRAERRCSDGAELHTTIHSLLQELDR